MKAIALFLAILIASCSTQMKSNIANSKPTATSVKTSQSSDPVAQVGHTLYLAANVLLGSGVALADTNDDHVDKTTKISPSDILLTDPDDKSKVGRLSSNNLLDALRNEIAVDLKSTLVGQWQVTTNINGSTRWDQSRYSGTITVNSDLSITLDSGCAYFIHRSFCKNSVDGLVLGDVNLKVLSSGTMFATVPIHETQIDVSDSFEYSVMLVVELTSTRMVIVNPNVPDSVRATLPEVAVLTKIN